MAERWWVYIIEKGGKFYIGITTDVDRADHDGCTSC
jgi:predicted GIY-YIG superfamily endonuclease